jgi:hypothetical protein
VVRGAFGASYTGASRLRFSGQPNRDRKGAVPGRGWYSKFLQFDTSKSLQAGLRLSRVLSAYSIALSTG